RPPTRRVFSRSSPMKATPDASAACRRRIRCSKRFTRSAASCCITTSTCIRKDTKASALRASRFMNDQGAGLQQDLLNDVDQCDHASAGTCPPAPAVSLQTAFDRFLREAVPGVCDTGRYRCPYFVWGSGAPLLFIPGVAASGRSFVLTIARL